ncbi:hypothetical protein [Streptomyces spongiae]|nr:hypothetical protein [Streptomyces spongiae]
MGCVRGDGPRRRPTADPVHLARLFGIHPGVAVKYVQTAHPDKALPAIR